MTYPPGGSGYPPGQQPTQQFSVPTQQFGKHEQTPQAQAPALSAAGANKLPFILLAAVAALGLLVYLFQFGEMFTISSTDFPQLGGASGTSLGLGLAVLASVLAALLAGVGLLPKQKTFVGVVAAIAVLGFLLVIGEVIQKPEQVSIGWALYVVIALSLLQAGAAIAALLLDAGIITPPAPKPPKYDKQQQQYGQYGAPGQYYGQPGQHAPHQGGPQQQRPGYPSQYGGYQGGSTGNFQQSGPPTPPTGFPTYGQPQAPSPAPTSQVPAQSQPSSSSNQSGNGGS
jgi:4-amino-4-deoxy-L-arabinose transferase-like glycosyltransferase